MVVIVLQFYMTLPEKAKWKEKYIHDRVTLAKRLSGFRDSPLSRSLHA